VSLRRGAVPEQQEKQQEMDEQYKSIMASYNYDNA